MEDGVACRADKVAAAYSRQIVFSEIVNEEKAGLSFSVLAASKLSTYIYVCHLKSPLQFGH